MFTRSKQSRVFVFVLIFLNVLFILNPLTVFASDNSSASNKGPVLAINIDQSIYQLGDRAYIQMATLDQNGHTLCGTNLKLEITSPSGHMAIFRTDNGTITRSTTCGYDNVTDKPDYFTNFEPREIGGYSLLLTNLDTNLSANDFFEVKQSSPVKIERIAATRINPFKSDYQMKVRISSDQTYVGQAIEEVPTSFEIMDVSGNGQIKENQFGQEIIWPAVLKAGESITYSYIYSSPKVSPELYFLGPFRLNNYLQETRQWQIASDTVITSTATGGTWATGTTWVGGAAPVAGDDAIIATTGANSVSLGAAAQIVNVTINSGATLAGSTFLLTVTGNYTNNGTHSGSGGVTVSGASSIINGTGSTTNTGTFTISGATAPSFAAAANITITGNLTMSGPVTITAGGIVTESGTTAISGAVTITNNGTFNANGASGITGSVAGSTWTQGSNSTLNFKGSGAVFLATGTLNASANGNTINYNYTGAQTVKATATYYHLTLSGSGIKTLTATTTAISGNLTLSGTATATTVVGLTVSGNLSVGNGTTFTAAGFALTITGTTTVGSGTSGNLTISSATGTKIFTGLVTINAGGTWTNTVANSAVTFRGGITNGGTFNSTSTGIQTFDTNAQALTGTLSIPKVTVTGITLTNNGTLTVTTALAGTGTLSNVGTLNINFTGAVGINNLAAIAVGNTVNYQYAGAQTVFATDYYHLTLSGSGIKTMQAGTTNIDGNLTISGSASMTGNAALVIGGALNYSSSGTTNLTAGNVISVGTWNQTAGTIIDNGIIILVGGTGANTWTMTGTFTASGTVIFGGLAPQIGASNFYNLSTFGVGNTTTAGAITIAGNFNIGDGTTFTAAGYVLTVNGTTTIGGGTSGTLIISSATGAKTFIGLVTIYAGGTWNNSINSPVTFRGGITTAGTFTAGSGIQTFDTNAQALTGTFLIPNVTVTGVTLTNNNTLTVSIALSGSGELAQGSNAVLNLGGTSGIVTLTATADANTVSYTSTTADQTIIGTAYVNLIIDKSGRIGILGGPTLVVGNLTITAGTLDVDNINNYLLIVNGDWTNNGIFLARQGTVTFSGAGTQTINGDNTWFGLIVTAAAARTVYFESGKTQTVAANGLLALAGASGQLLTLAPKTAATAWNLTVDNTAMQSVTYVSVSYSDASSGAEINGSDTTNFDGGNNTHWNLPVALPPPPPSPPPTPPKPSQVPTTTPTPTIAPTPLPTPIEQPVLQPTALSLWQSIVSSLASAWQATEKIFQLTINAIAIAFEKSGDFLIGSARYLGQVSKNVIAQAQKGTRSTFSFLGQGLNKTYSGLARVWLGIEKFKEIVFDKEPNHISNVKIANVSAQEIIITWETNHLSTSQINYGSAVGVYEETVFVKDQTRKHQVTLKNLKPQTTYYYELISKNRDYAVDAFRSFTTLAQ